MSLELDSVEPASQPAVRPPFYRRPLVVIGAVAIVAVIVLGVFVAIALLGSKPSSPLADASTTAPVSSPAPTASVTPTQTLSPTPTPTPSPSAVHQAAPVKPKPPASQPKPPAKAPALTPTISNLTVAKTQSCSNPGVTHITAILKWTSTNAVRASLKSVSSYPSVSSHAPDTVITAVDNSGQLNSAVSCTYAKVVYTLTLEYEATGAPATYASASIQLDTTT